MQSKTWGDTYTWAWIYESRWTALGVQSFHRDHHTIKLVVRYEFEELAKLVAFALLISVGDPSTFQEAMNSLEKDKWVGAMVEEMKSL